MSERTRSQSDKDIVEELYKTALETHSQSRKRERKSRHPLFSSTPAETTNPIAKTINFSLEESGNNIDITDKTLFLQVSEFDSTDSDVETYDNSLDTVKPIDTNDNIHINDSDSENPDIMAQNPFATLKYAVEAVPFFDGSNIPLSYFIEGCEEAKSMLPREAEGQFVKILRTRIVGEARRTIQENDFETVSQLTAFLKRIYGPAKNIYQLQGELGCIYQKSEENVVTYANRVKILGKQILEAYKGSGSSALDPSVKASIEKDMNKCFIRGLKPEIEQRIVRNLDVNDTVADALRIEKELREMTDLRQRSGSDPDKTKAQPTNLIREICQVCSKEGHVASNCRKLTQLSSQNKTDLGTEILICQICKKRGHAADKCRSRDPRSRQTVNVIQENLISCQLCSKTGHDAKTCRQNNNQISKPKVICQ